MRIQSMMFVERCWRVTVVFFALALYPVLEDQSQAFPTERGVRFTILSVALLGFFLPMLGSVKTYADVQSRWSALFAVTAAIVAATSTFFSMRYWETGVFLLAGFGFLAAIGFSLAAGVRGHRATARTRDEVSDEGRLMLRMYWEFLLPIAAVIGVVLALKTSVHIAAFGMLGIVAWQAATWSFVESIDRKPTRNA